MTRFIHDQFCKDLLGELLAPFGKVQSSRRVRSEVREIDIWFSPDLQTTYSSDALGLLGQFARTPSSFEPFRNAVTENEMCDCLLKLLELRGEVIRKAKRDKIEVDPNTLPKLWVLTPTASEKILNSFHARLDPKQWPDGVYLLGHALRAAIVVIHKLPRTPETLWLRILGKGKVQRQAIDELESLRSDSPFRANALELLLNLRITLEARQDIDVDEDDRELIMRLSPLYEQKLLDATQSGVQQGQRQLIENLLKARFGAMDDELSTVVERLSVLSPEDSSPLILNLSRQELIAQLSNGQQEGIGNRE